MPLDTGLAGKVAIIAGAGPGTGRSLALMMAKEGAKLALAARTASRLDAIVEEVKALGGEALAIPCDITKIDQVKNLADTTHKTFGRIDVLVNLAFSAVRRGALVSYSDEEMEQFRKSMETGAFGNALVCRYVAPYMIDAGSGNIVNVTSLSSRNGYKNRIDWAAGKAGVHLMSLSLTDELGPHGIRVNTVAPGHIWSEGLKRAYEDWAKTAGRTYEEEYDVWTRDMAMRKPPTSDDVARAILFMASDLSTGIAGATLDVNGGHRLQFPT